MKSRTPAPGEGTGAQNNEPSQPTLPLEGLPEPEHSVNPFFVHDAIRLINAMVAAGRTVTADDLIGVGRPEKSNSTGSIFAQLRRSGRIERIGYCPSRRSGRHGSAIAVWRGVR